MELTFHKDSLTHHEVFLCAETITLVAQRTLQPVACGWNDCSIKLNSWESLYQHLALHCQKKSSTSSLFPCSWKRCSKKRYNSPENLLKHVFATHIKNIAIPCPIKGCKENFARHHLLATHFTSLHREFDNQWFHYPSTNILRPMALLFHPPGSIQTLKGLPKDLKPYRLVTPVITPHTRDKSKALARQPHARQSSAGISEGSEEGSEIVHDELVSASFTDAMSEMMQTGDILVRHFSSDLLFQGALQFYRKNCSPLAPLPLYENPPKLTGIEALERKLALVANGASVPA